MKKRRKLFDESFEEVLKETGSSIYGGAGGGGAGTFSYAQQAGAKTWAPKSPPFRRQTGGPSDYNIKDIADDDAVFAKTARIRKPFPLETIDEHLVQAYIYACNAEQQIRACLKYNVVIADSKDKRALLQHLLKKVIGVKEIIKSVTEDLDRITLS